MKTNREPRNRYTVRMIWSEGAETVVLEDGMVLNLDNLLRLNPHLKDHPNLNGALTGKTMFYTVDA